MQRSKILSYIGFAAKSGNLRTGVNAVATLKKANLLAVCKRASENNDIYVQTICDYIHQNYAIISKEEELARLINFSTYHTRRIFKKKTGTTPMHYLTTYRIYCAKNILRIYSFYIPILSFTAFICLRDT